jgi:large subunit ribosomal protein L9
MQVILLEKVANLGNLGDVVRVKDGYGRNFLIPNRIARRATNEAIAEFEAKRAELEKAAAEKMTGLRVEIAQKSGVDGRLFGSVTNHDVAAALGKQGYKVDKAQIRMPQGPLKTTGDHPLSVSLHTDVAVEITVVVVGEQV